MNIKELAEQAGLIWDYSPAYQKCLTDFAELVRQDERDKCVQDYLQDCADAVDAEREACAKLCEEFGQNLGAYKAYEDSHNDGWQDACCEIETAIRGRGDK
jgi:hypothetical protein